MRKILVITGMILLLMITYTEAKEIENKEVMPPFNEYHDREKNQTYGNFLLELCRGDIIRAMKDYYDGHDIDGYATPWWEQYDMVSISEAKQEGIQAYPFIVTFTLIPQENNGNDEPQNLGTDTLYFAINPSLFTTKDFQKGHYPVKLLKYEHHEPPNQSND
ncbi:hypothetical protein EV207_1628 [Scopulibacillus darangshiensis]|uniref:DUF3888 domain-containing protein n=1 Tax=Scopulibacillus darangshiensis TaxID=442528 RepID=A0A4R2NE44_9BACL|nr:hypothetical protein [Scopulibacillus darangshiensis]TCP19503.1 hypothetical protein EV207_1628 [Scopulibacillus darangshiensis]